MSQATCSVWFLSAALLAPVAVFGADAIYKSVDESGRITYSSKPPQDAVEIEGVSVPRGPSAQDATAAQDRVKDLEQKTDAQIQTLREGRQQAARARKEAQEAAERQQLAREAADRQRRIDNSLDRLANERDYFRPYPHDWRWPYRPLRPLYPAHPPRPPRRAVPLNRPYEDHINPPTRNW